MRWDADYSGWAERRCRVPSCCDFNLPAVRTNSTVIRYRSRYASTTMSRTCSRRNSTATAHIPIDGQIVTSYQWSIITVRRNRCRIKYSQRTVIPKNNCSRTTYSWPRPRPGLFNATAFSALTLLVGRQEGHPVCKKTEWWGAGVVICLQWGADLHTAQLMPLPLTVSCFSKIQIGFYLSGTGSPGKSRTKGR